MKENRCKIKFECSDWCGCVYFKKAKKPNSAGNHECHYSIYNYTCTSKVAQANAMVLKMKEMGIEFNGEQSTKE